MPRARMNVSAPRRTFLSCAMASRRLSASPMSPGILQSRRQPDGLQMTRHPPCILTGRQTETRREAERQRHADSDPLAMDQTRAIVCDGPLQRVAERMPQIEQGAVAILVFVTRHDSGLGGAALRHGIGAGLARLEHSGAVRLAPFKKARSSMRPYFTTSA